MNQNQRDRSMEQGDMNRSDVGRGDVDEGMASDTESGIANK